MKRIIPQAAEVQQLAEVTFYIILWLEKKSTTCCQYVTVDIRFFLDCLKIIQIQSIDV